MVNNGIDIETLNSYAALKLDGYTFLGWARMPEMADQVATYAPSFAGKYTVDDVENLDGTTTQKIVSYEGLTENELWLVYHPAEGDNAAYFSVRENNTELNNGAAFTQIAANENTPYHGLYAVWQRDVFYVLHSSTGELEAVSMPINASGTAVSGVSYMVGTADLTSHVKPGYLYGGYYMAEGDVNYAYANVKHADVQAVADAYTANNAAANWTAAAAAGNDQSKAYTLATTTMSAQGKSFKNYFGDFLYVDSEGNGTNTQYVKNSDGTYTKNTPVWNKKAAQKTVRGDAVTPKPGAIFYLKEVPSQYLAAKMFYTYDTTSPTKEIKDIWLISLLDDGNYQNAGYMVQKGSEEESFVPRKSLSLSFSMIQQAGSSNPEDVVVSISAADFNNVNGGVVMAAQKTDFAGESFTVVPTYTTPDGVKVTNNGLNFAPNSNREEGGKLYTWTRHFDGTEIMYFDYNGGTGVNWTQDAVQQMAYFFKGSGNTATHAWVKMEYVSNGLHFCKVPEGDWEHVILVRMDGAPVGPDANGEYWYREANDDQTGDIPLNSTSDGSDQEFSSNANYIVKFAKGSATVDWAYYPANPS